ncbi:hypothetical protein [Micromonospora sp. NBC_00858]|uniref:GHMP family kinase ATP-binding protein n=1 Tax=Micromonospora sp. NBC_00858 TaxID=2975979 RepID=UPI003863E77A|nr:hypothetical protein OG990_24655 [Micromonospora sp. NBC_00858]
MILPRERPEEAASVASAPLRADLTGGFTDCEPFLGAQPARMVSAALGHRVTVRAMRTPGHYSVRMVDPRGLVVDVPCLDPGRGGTGLERLLGKLLLLLGIPAHIEVTVPLPMGSGTGSSATVLTAATSAVLALDGGAGISVPSVPHVVAAVERLCGHHGGLQDQFAATFGGLTSYSFHERGVDVHRLGRAHGVLRGAVLAIPPPAQRRTGSDRLVQLVAERFRSGSADTITALAALVELGEQIGELLSAGRPGPAELSPLLLAVLDRQRQLHPVIRAGIEETPVWALVRAGAAVGKPLGGAGRGSAWLLLGATGAARQQLASAGWVVHKVRISDVGVRTESEPRRETTTVGGTDLHDSTQDPTVPGAAGSGSTA